MDDVVDVTVGRFSSRVSPNLYVNCDPNLRRDHPRRGKSALIDRARVVAGQVHLAEHRRVEGAGLDQPGRGNVDNVATFGACQPLRSVAQVGDREGRSERWREATEDVAV